MTTPAVPAVPTVEASWLRIESWLERHAPAGARLLRPPAPETEIRAAEERLGVTFPDDLTESLLRHDGVELDRGTPVLSLYGPLSRVSDIVRSTTFLRSVAEELLDEVDEVPIAEHELGAYWRREWLLVTLGIGWQSSDGIFLTCHPGPNHGRVGYYFDEDAPSFTAWPTLRHLLADFAEALETGTSFDHHIPLAHDGTLLWESPTEVTPDPVSLLTLAVSRPEPEPAPTPAPTSGPGPAYGATISTSPITPDGREHLRAHLGTSAYATAPAPSPIPHDLLLAEGLTPEDLLHRLGAITETLRPRSRARARLAGASSWAARRPLIRCGSSGGWAYAVQEFGTPQFDRPEVLRRVSEGCRTVALTTRGVEAKRTAWLDGTPIPSLAQQLHGRFPERRAAASRYPTEGAHTAAMPHYHDLLTELPDDFGLLPPPNPPTEPDLPSALVLPLLDDLPEPRSTVADEIRDFDLAQLLARTPHDQLRRAMTRQLTRLTTETGAATHPEISRATATLSRGRYLDLTVDHPLDRRLRILQAEAEAARPTSQSDFSAWIHRSQAGDAIRALALQPLPHATAHILHRRLSIHWRTELTTDLTAD